MTATRRRITGLIGIAIGLFGLVFVIIPLAQGCLSHRRDGRYLLAVVVGIAGRDEMLRYSENEQV